MKLYDGVSSRRSFRLLAGPGTFAAGSARVLFSLSLASADSRISGVIRVILPIDENEGGSLESTRGIDEEPGV